MLSDCQNVDGDSADVVLSGGRSRWMDRPPPSYRLAKEKLKVLLVVDVLTAVMELHMCMCVVYRVFCRTAWTC